MTESRHPSLPADRLPDRRLQALTPRPIAVRELPARLSPLPSTERRNHSAREALLCRVRCEFEEMRGLRITLPQAKRLFGLREDVCVRILDTLIHDGVLARRSDGCYGRRDVA